MLLQSTPVHSAGIYADLPLPSLADLAEVDGMTLKAIREVVRLSRNKKMPGASFDLPVSSCQTGGALSEIPGTPCAECYAKSGPISWPGARAMHERNLAALDHPLFVPMLARLFGAVPGDDQRLHAAGDLQSVEHLALYVAVAVLVPHKRFWIPTQERAIVRTFERRYGPLADLAPNLRVRISMPKLDTIPTPSMTGTYSLVSTGARELPDDVWVCPSERQNGTCGDCRTCWTDERIVAYPVH